MKSSHLNYVAVSLIAMLFVTVFPLFANGGKEGGTVVTYEAPPREEASFVPSPSGLSALEALQNQFRVVADQVLPVVVEVNVVDVVEGRRSFNFFGQRGDNQQFRQPGLGSGVIVGRSDDLIYVITNNHVVETADEIEVVLYDGREFIADVVGADSRMDLALLKFKTSDDVPIAILGDSDSLMVGDWVFAVGNPLGFEATLTSGIVSALGRQADNLNNFTQYIQTDAAINSGNSGGALVNLYGEVVGINTWIASNSGGSIGLGFSIPINTAKDAISDFIESGEVAYGWLGITVGTLNDDAKADLGYNGLDGGFVYNVIAGSPAADAGLKPGDLITRIGEVDLEDSDDLMVTVGSLAPGDVRSFEVSRLGEAFAVDVKIGRRNEMMIESGSFDSWPGFSVVALTDVMRDNAGIPDDAGSLVVASVDEQSRTSETGFRPGDIISAIDGEEVVDLRDFYTKLNSDSQKKIEFSIWRRGNTSTIEINRQ